MNLYPQDLREGYHREIIVLRASYSGPTTPETRAVIVGQPQTRRPVGRLGRLWLGKLPLTPQQAEMVLPASTGSTKTMAWLSQLTLTGLSGLVSAILHKHGVLTSPEAWGTTVLAGGALLYPSFVAWPRAALKSHYDKPLTVADIEGLTSHAQTPLERDYLALLRETMTQPIPEAAQADVRTAIQALGQAVDALPSVESAPVDTVALRREADALRERALQELDQIIADSQENRADALLRRADAADRSAQYARRITALQEEITAQIAATRQDLTAFRADGNSVSVNSVSLARLAQAGKQIANVAVSAARAREELDSFALPQTADERRVSATDWRPATASASTAEEESVQVIRAGIR